MRNFRWLSVFSKSGTLAILLALTMPLSAAVNTDRTRVVFNASDIAQSLQLANDGAQPIIMQVWLDRGDPTSSPAENITSIVALPPVFKIEPGEVKSLRLMLSSRKFLTQGEENLFWLNLYQIPPSQKAADRTQQIVLPLRLRLKVLVRPSGVAELQQPDGERLQFTAYKKNLRINNPTAWHISFIVKPPKQPAIGNLMLAPGEAMTIPLPQAVAANEKLSYEVINDTGNRWVYEANVAVPDSAEASITTAEPVTDKPTTTATEPVTDKPATTAAEPVTDKPAITAAGPITDKPATTIAEPVTDKFATTAAEPITDKPATTAAEPITDAPEKLLPRQ